MMQMKCKETTQYPECPVVNLQQSRDSDLLSVTTSHAPRESRRMPEGRCPSPPQEPSVQPSSPCPPLPAVLHHGKAQDPPSCLPTTYLMLKPQVPDSPLLLLPRLDKDPRVSVLMDRPKTYLWALSCQRLEETLTFWSATTYSSLNSFLQKSQTKPQYVNISKAEQP